jgi:hypothetical protein
MTPPHRNILNVAVYMDLPIAIMVTVRLYTGEANRLCLRLLPACFLKL